MLLVTPKTLKGVRTRVPLRPFTYREFLLRRPTHTAHHAFMNDTGACT